MARLTHVVVLAPVVRGHQVPVSQQAETEKGEGHLFGEEGAADARVNMGKRIAHTARNHILESCRLPDKRRAVSRREQVAVPEEGIGEGKDCVPSLAQLRGSLRTLAHSRRNGSAERAHAVVRSNPARQISCGARKRQKARQSRYDTGPSSIVSCVAEPALRAGMRRVREGTFNLGLFGKLTLGDCIWSHRSFNLSMFP